MQSGSSALRRGGPSQRAVCGGEGTRDPLPADVDQLALTVVKSCLCVQIWDCMRAMQHV